jgi:hypothetical protein
MSTSITKKIQLIRLNRGGDIQNSYRKDTYGPPCSFTKQIHSKRKGTLPNPQKGSVDF